MSCDCAGTAPAPRLGVPTTTAMGWALQGAAAVNNGIAKAGGYGRWWVPVVAIAGVGVLYLMMGRKS